MEKTEDSGDEIKAKRVKLNHYSSQEDDSDSPSKSESETKNESSENKNDSLEKSDKKEEDNQYEKSTEFSSFVAAHYNACQGGFEKRNKSRIYYLRNFNNWVKSLLIIESVKEVQDSNYRNLKVLDMCCGKGGDLFKWLKTNIKYLVCADIAELSLEEYKTRVRDYLDKCEKHHRYCSIKCEFIAADCTRVRLRGKYRDPSIQFDIVSCQFSFHYGFESLPQAECMLKNATECLKPGGLFIGTIPNAYEIVKRLKQSKSNCFKNEIFSLEMCSEEPYPLFGAKYNFSLEKVVNCPEFLVHFPTFEKLALKYGLKLVKKEKFTELFERMKKTREGEILMRKIIALETYTKSAGGEKLLGQYKDYVHAEVFCEANNVQQVGTLSQCEWDVVSMYQTFVFKKCEPSK